MAKKGFTFKGEAKPFGKTGHFNEPRRHSLQAKGFKTGHFKPVTLNSQYWSLERTPADKIKVTLGNFSDAGWFWDGDKSQMAGFVIRLHDSKARDDFLLKMEKNHIKLSDFKEDILKSAEKGDGIYELTGDNAKWHFGEDSEELFEAEQQVAEDEGVDVDELSKATDESDYKGTDFDAFKKSSYYKDVKENLIKSVKESSSWENLFSRIDEIKDDAMQDSFSFSSESANELVMAGLGKLKGGK